MSELCFALISFSHPPSGFWRCWVLSLIWFDFLLFSFWDFRGNFLFLYSDFQKNKSEKNKNDKREEEEGGF